MLTISGGGISYTGSTTCVSGSVCTYENAYFYQCLPGTASTTSTSSSATTLSTSTTKTTSSTSSSASATSTSTGLTRFGKLYSCQLLVQYLLHFSWYKYLWFRLRLYDWWNLHLFWNNWPLSTYRRDLPRWPRSNDPFCEWRQNEYLPFASWMAISCRWCPWWNVECCKFGAVQYLGSGLLDYWCLLHYWCKLFFHLCIIFLLTSN